MIYIKLRYLAFIILFINLFCSTAFGFDTIIDEPIKVGIYEDTPYITINSNNEITGYYAEFLELIKREGNVDYTFVLSDFSDLLRQLKNGSIDILMGLSSVKATKYKSIYNFKSNPVYIYTNKNNVHILNYINSKIEQISLREKNLITSLYNKYFHSAQKILKIKSDILFLLLVILLIIFYFIFIKIKINKFKTKKKIRSQIDKDKYLLYYQPILNPHNNEIIGFEGLLRLLNDNNEVLSPYHFLKEIEDNDMLFEISLWILKKIIKTYNLISNHINSKDIFYISMNISLNEIRDENFVNSAIEILLNSKLGPNKICLEIVENVKIDKLDILNASIKKLKAAGFKIAIDDFGIGYSNLDILKKIDFDIVKLDKYFVDDLSSSQIKQEVIRFVSKIATITNKSLVIEGVEEYYQLNLLKSLQNNKLYIQGYLYSKPLPLEEILST